MNALWVVQCPCNISKINAELPGQIESSILFNLLGWCDCLFQYEINYLAHHASKEDIWPGKENLKAVAEFTPPQNYTEIHYQWFIKGFASVVQPLHKHLPGEGAGKKNKWVTLSNDAQATIKTLKKACLEAPILSFADFNKPFLLETNASKLGLGVMLSQKQPDGWCHSVTYLSWSLTVHEHNYDYTKQEFLALKWAIAQQFQGYLHWKQFVVKTDNNPFTYILTTPNLDATQHHWVESLVGFTFTIEYQKGRDNVIADALSHVASRLMQKLCSPFWEESP